MDKISFTKLSVSKRKLRPSDSQLKNSHKGNTKILCASEEVLHCIQGYHAPILTKTGDGTSSHNGTASIGCSWGSLRGKTEGTIRINNITMFKKTK